MSRSRPERAPGPGRPSAGIPGSPGSPSIPGSPSAGSPGSPSSPAESADRAAAGPSERAELPLGSARPLAEVYDTALLDLDGVVYLGRSAIPGAREGLAAARAAGMRLAFVTNNASRSPSAIADQLTSLGVPARSSDVVTSAQAAARLLAGRLPAGAKVLVSGGIGLRIALRERGLVPVSTAAEGPAAVVQGYAPDLTYALLAEAAIAVGRGAWFVAANADRTLPTPRGPQPGNGSLAGLITAVSGTRPEVAGKPEPPLHAEAVARTGARRPLVVGDRLDTDIEGAVRAGADSLLVLTGVSGPADVLLAPAGRRPRYLARGLGGLVQSHPGVIEAGDSFCCGQWVARVDSRSGRLDLAGSGDRVDGLRALAIAAWSVPGGVTEEMIRPALGVLRLGSPGHPPG